MEPLSPRQQSILNRVVDRYIETAHPVGSRLITELYTELYRDSYSPATARHEMGLLEAMGYLTQPHTSAGRVPTDLGYRYYVDHGLRPENFSGNFIQQLTRDLMGGTLETVDETFANEISRILSRLSGEAGLVMSAQKRPPTLAFQGASHMLEKPEFQDVQKVRMIIQTFEEKEPLMDWLTQRISFQGVVVTIGRENEPEAFRDCAVVSAGYSIGGARRGVLAILGPRRMNYSRIVPLVSQMGRILERILDSASE